MEVPILILLTALTLAAAFYAHAQLPTQTRSTASLWFSRLILGLIGIGFGWVMSAFYYPSEGLIRLLVFLSAFGLVHVPAAAILYLKKLRRDQGA